MAEYYVYTLSDPRSGHVFYVGKGSGDRILAHEKEANGGAYSEKCNRIREIWREGENVVREKVSHHADENEALDREEALIDLLGIENLTNVLPGGKIGAEAYIARQAERQKRIEDREAEAFRKSFDVMAPKFAQMFRDLDRSGGFGMSLDDKWHEFSGCLVKLFWEMVNAFGFDAAGDVMRKHGVEIVGFKDGSIQSKA